MEKIIKIMMTSHKINPGNLGWKTHSSRDFYEWFYCWEEDGEEEKEKGEKRWWRERERERNDEKVEENGDEWDNNSQETWFLFHTRKRWLFLTISSSSFSNNFRAASFAVPSLSQIHNSSFLSSSSLFSFALFLLFCRFGSFKKRFPPSDHKDVNLRKKKLTRVNEPLHIHLQGFEGESLFLSFSFFLFLSLLKRRGVRSERMRKRYSRKLKVFPIFFSNS